MAAEPTDEFPLLAGGFTAEGRASCRQLQLQLLEQQALQGKSLQLLEQRAPMGRVNAQLGKQLVLLLFGGPQQSLQQR